MQNRNDFSLLFLMGLFPRYCEHEILDNTIGQPQSAANNLQKEIISGLMQIGCKNVSIINAPYIGAYPFNYKKLFAPAEGNLEIDGISYGFNVSFVDIALFKHFSRRLSFRKQLKDWAEYHRNNEKVLVVAYALTSDNIACIRYLKNLIPQCRSCVVVPDLPEYMSTKVSRSVIKKGVEAIKKWDTRQIYRKIELIDGYITLTEEMAKRLHADQYLVMEGISPINPYRGQKKKNGKKIVAYTGTLNKKYGILDLIDSFTALEYDCELWICGDGDAAEYVRNAARKDSRIKYLGVRSRDEILEIQAQSTLLVNPRKNIGEYTKYSFPSKLLEYLSSGVPVLAYKLNGVPDEYDAIIRYVDTTDSSSLANSIKEMLDLEERDRNILGERAVQFVLERKTPMKQAERMNAFFRALALGKTEK